MQVNENEKARLQVVFTGCGERWLCFLLSGQHAAGREGPAHYPHPQWDVRRCECNNHNHREVCTEIYFTPWRQRRTVSLTLVVATTGSLGLEGSTVVEQVG